MRAILTYHSIDPSGSVISVSERIFRKHVEWLARGPVAVVPLGEIASVAEDKDAVALTFDDGFGSFSDVAAPLLREAGLPATVFVVTDRVGRTNEWGGEPDDAVPTLPLMDWTEIGSLAGDGFEIGSHTRTHARLPALEERRVADELVGSAEEIERRTGRRPRSFAYPFGAVDRSSAEAAAREYERACTARLAPLGVDDVAHRLPRLDAYYFRRSGQLEGWGSPVFRGRLRVRRCLRALRSTCEVRIP